MKITAAIIEADLNGKDRITFSINKTKDYKEVLGFAGREDTLFQLESDLCNPIENIN